MFVSGDDVLIIVERSTHDSLMYYIEEVYYTGEIKESPVTHGVGIIIRDLRVSDCYFNFLAKDGFYFNG
jgi:hypothetical protein